MFEQYHPFRYNFSELNTSLQAIHDNPSYTAPLDAIEQASFELLGYAEVLPFFPQTTEDQKDYLHLQSLSFMSSPEGYYTRREHYASYLLLYTHSGKGQLTYENKTIRLQAGDLFWIDCDKHHEYQTTGPLWQHTDLHFHGPGADRLYREFRLDHDFVLHNISAAFYQCHLDALLTDYVHHAPHRSMRIAHRLEALLFDLTCKNLQTCFTEKPVRNVSPSDEIDQTIDYLVFYMQQHYAEDLTLDFLARFSGISKYHLTREFHRRTGFPPNEYLLQLRIQQACFLLENTSLPARKISFMVGIDNETYFSRLFRKRLGCTPGEWRKGKK